MTIIRVIAALILRRYMLWSSLLLDTLLIRRAITRLIISAAQTIIIRPKIFRRSCWALGLSASTIVSSSMMLDIERCSGGRR